MGLPRLALHPPIKKVNAVRRARRDREVAWKHGGLAERVSDLSALDQRHVRHPTGRGRWANRKERNYASSFHHRADPQA